MTINTKKLVSMNVFQDILVNKDGTPMSYGNIVCFSDKERTKLKNWYYRSSSSSDSLGEYTYSALPNPLTLSGAGTVCDVNGADVIPFFYPYSEIDESQEELYFIEIRNAKDTYQLTRAGFPYDLGGSNGSGGTAMASDTNYIINNGFYYNVGDVSAVDAGTKTDIILAPSNHEGFQYPDIRLQRDAGNSSVDAISFKAFGALSSEQQVVNAVLPQYYVEHTCTGGTAATKRYMFPISSDIEVLPFEEFCVSIVARTAPGYSGAAVTLQLSLLQDTGTGTTAPAPMLIGQQTLTTAWQKFSFLRSPIDDVTPLKFPDSNGLVISAARDSGWYLCVDVPLVACDISFTLPSLFLGSSVSSNDFQTKDYVDSIALSDRCGDVKPTFGTYPFGGFVPMNDGTIGAVASLATTRANPDTWFLYKLIWDMAKPRANGASNPIALIYNLGESTPTTFGATAYEDFTANKRIQLFRMMGRVLMGSVPFDDLQAPYVLDATTSANNFIFSAATFSGSIYDGMPVWMPNAPSGLTANVIYYVTNYDYAGTSFQLATTYENAMARSAITGIANQPVAFKIYLDQTGMSIGEYGHKQLTDEVGNHTHTTTTESLNYVGTTSHTYPSGSGGWLGGNVAIAENQAANAVKRANITQPGTFANIYIKL